MENYDGFQHYDPNLNFNKFWCGFYPSNAQSGPVPSNLEFLAEEFLLTCARVSVTVGVAHLLSYSKGERLRYIAASSMKNSPILSS